METKLLCTTRGGAAPKGKSRVFLYCHPEDRIDYFELLLNELLDHVDCAVYHLQNKEEDLSLLGFELQEMNLFAVPVSAKLLTDEKGQIGALLAQADRNGIPVLPVVMESGLTDAYAKVFGNRQYLDKYLPDPTAIPYAEKLRNFLSAVLLGDETADQVRAAFDAYVFLSYRKKDRVYAQTLMRLIHQNAFARDIAIWYDEFLTPGEDFNDLIAEALQKSALFVLTVTPNLVNENNYVAEIEYPMAVEAGKPVAPVEMEETDAGALRKRFQGIPDSVPAEDPAALEQLLRVLLPAVGRNESEDPQHLFFIGLAYLAGIDVEKDPARAETLIRRAADAGLDAATEKLTDMYYYGEGVPQDYKKALECYGALVKKYAAIAEKTRKDAELAVMIGYAMRSGELALNAGLYEEARRSYEGAFEAAKVLAFSSGSDNPFTKMFSRLKKLSGRNAFFADAFFDMTVCCRRLMEIYGTLGMVETAASWGAKIANPATGYAADAMEDPRLSGEMMQIYGKMGRLCLESGNVPGAETWFEKEKNLASVCEEKIARYAEIQIRRDYAMLEENLGNYAQACAYTKQACTRCYSLYEESRSPQLMETTILLALETAALYEKTGDPAQAAEWLTDTERLMRTAQEKRRPLYMDRIESLVCFRKGSLLMKEGNFEEALRQTEAGLPYIRRQCEETLDSEATKEVVSALLLRGECLSALERCEEAARELEQAGVFIKDTVFFTRSVRDTRIAAAVYEKLMDVYLKIGYGVYAKKWYDMAQFHRNAVSVSSRLPADARALAELEAKKPLLKTVPFAPEGVRRLVDTFKDAGGHYPGDAAAERQLGEVMLEFYKTHPRFSARLNVHDLGLLLSGQAEKQGERTLRIVTENKTQNRGKIIDAVLANLKPFLKYDEEAYLIASYCGFSELLEAKRVIGGWDAAVRDLDNFFFDAPMLSYRAEDVKYPMLWYYVTLLRKRLQNRHPPQKKA